MRRPLDPHMLVWSASESNRLSSHERDLMADPENDRWVSVATACEIEHKRTRDAELARFPRDLDDLRALRIFDWRRNQAATAGRLPRHHGESWDRIVSIDAALPIYGARMTW